MSTLNVIFHGTFLFCKNKEEENQPIHVYLPNVPSHVFRAGNWLAETVIAPGIYQLEGVKKGSIDLGLDKNNLIIAGGRAHAQGQPWYAKLILPQPKEYCTPRTAPVDRKLFTDPNGNPISALPPDMIYHDKMGTLTIFTYEFEKDEDLILSRVDDSGRPHSWEAAFSGEPPTVNLHVFAAHEVEEGLEEPESAFTFTMKLFAKPPLALGRTNMRSKLDVHQLPTGVIREECEDLAPRLQRMARLGRKRKDGADLVESWSISDALDDEPSACACSYCC
jgi:hypothetical protein